MGELNVESRSLFIADNLEVLRGINSESIDLIATDPPFNKGVKDFEGTVVAGTDTEGRKVRYKDVWTWGNDVQGEWTESIREDHPNLYAVIRAANAAAGEDMGAYLCWLGIRVLEMHRVLKPTGSMYLHIDDTAHAYAKAMMDSIFGRKNCRNVLTWKRATSHNDARRYGRVCDTILYYTKDTGATWNGTNVAIPKTAEQLAVAYPQQDQYGPVRFSDLTGAGVSGGESGEPWRGYEVSGRGRHWAPPKTSSYAKYIERHFIPGYRSINGVHARLDALDAAGLIHHPQKGRWPGLKRYAAADTGNPPIDIILDIPGFTNYNRKDEATGYPTQKPLALYERIIKASSNEGDIVLDPFAGCATTCVAAERLGRGWIGIDINRPARKVIGERLKSEVKQSMAWGKLVKTPSKPPKRTDDGEEAAPELVLVSPRPKAPKLTARELRGRLTVADGLKCQGCGWVPHHEEYLEVDHRVPKSVGGKDDMRNRVLLCSPCNGTKGNRLTLAELRLKRIAEDRMQDKSWTHGWYERVGKHGGSH